MARRSAGTAALLSIALLAGCASAGAGQPPRAPRGVGAAPSPSSCGGGAPTGLVVPAGHRLAFELTAEGVQIYLCAASEGGHAWTFQAPEAGLADPYGHRAGRHFGGPTWEAADGSRVVAAKAAAASPDAAAIPWLLLRATQHAGDGRMAAVAWIQRVDTSGGLPPAGGCDASTAGTVARVAYRARYCFHAIDGAAGGGRP
jgi:hypothetical protein